MSYYYNYYLGYRDKNTGLFYHLGPYDCDGKLNCVFYRSRSFASDIHELFYSIPDKKYSQKLKDEFSFEDYNDEIQFDDVSYLPVNELPDSDFIKRGYYLVDDVETYLDNGKELFDLGIFYEHLEPEVFAAKQSNELLMGMPPTKYDFDGEAFEQHACSEYMYFAYPDYESQAYESFLLKTACKMYEDYDKDKELVVLKTEG